MTYRATGTFEVAMKSPSTPQSAPGSALDRMSLDNKFEGNLVGVGKGEMLSVVTETKGSAAYVVAGYLVLWQAQFEAVPPSTAVSSASTL